MTKTLRIQLAAVAVCVAVALLQLAGVVVPYAVIVLAAGALLASTIVRLYIERHPSPRYEWRPYDRERP